MLPGPPLSLSSQQPPEEEAALSLWTGSGEDKAEQVKVTKKEGREGDKEGMEKKHDTEEVTSPFIGKFSAVGKLGEQERWGGREGDAGMQDVFWGETAGMALVHLSPQFGCSASAPRTS